MMKMLLNLIQRGIKQREEAISQYSAASRDDLVEKEQEQIDVFMLYLPNKLSDEELEAGMKEIITKGSNIYERYGKSYGSCF
jgi:uncharacterized protein YqeY